MSIMTKGVIGMPYTIAMNSEMSRRQFYSHAQVLLAENDRLRTAEGDAMTYKAGMENVAQQRDQLKADHDQVATAYTELREAMFSLESQGAAKVAGLRSENEALRKLAVELRGAAKCYNLHHCKAEQHGISEPCKVLERIDAAMGK